MDKVLEYRIQYEESVLERYSLLEKDLQQHKAKLNVVVTQYENYKEKSVQKKKIEDLRQQFLYEQKMEDEIRRQNEIIKKITDKLENTRLELVEAQKHRKIMEKLKEKDYNKYKEMIKNIEQKELDELGVMMFTRR
ncbi:MAG: flagellar export protein FliJ [Eubacteriales bacterium]